MALKRKRHDYNEQFLEQLITDVAEVARSDSGLGGRLLAGVPSRVLLQELHRRGGHPGAVAEAVLLCAAKSADYNHGMGHENIHSVDRSAYFPFGEVSYAQMLHTKMQRFTSIVRKGLSGGEPNFEGLRDTALDIINYAGFYVASEYGRAESCAPGKI